MLATAALGALSRGDRLHSAGPEVSFRRPVVPAGPAILPRAEGEGALAAACGISGPTPAIPSRPGCRWGWGSRAALWGGLASFHASTVLGPRDTAGSQDSGPALTCLTVPADVGKEQREFQTNGMGGAL